MKQIIVLLVLIFSFSQAKAATDKIEQKVAGKECLAFHADNEGFMFVGQKNNTFTKKFSRQIITVSIGDAPISQFTVVEGFGIQEMDLGIFIEHCEDWLKENGTEELKKAYQKYLGSYKRKS